MFIATFALIPKFTNEKTLPFVADYPFDWTISPFYEITYVCHLFFIVLLGLGVSVGEDLLVMAILLSTAYQFFILRICFEVFNTDGINNVNKKLRKLQSDQLDCKYDELTEYFIRCVRHHEMLLR